jgi:hypothetical protein
LEDIRMRMPVYTWHGDTDSSAPWPALMHAFWTLIWMLSLVWPDPPRLY